jgi:hypothetical protein
MMTSRIALRVALPLLVLLIAPVSAGAEDLCPRTPQWGQVPNFWDPEGASEKKQLAVRYDGRWAGASQVPLTNGDSGARARFLDGGDGHLYVALELDTTGTDREVFWLGYAPASATDSGSATLIEITLRPDPTQPSPATQLIEQQALRCGAVTCPAAAACTATPCSAPPPRSASYRILRGVSGAGGSKFLWDGTAFDTTVTTTWITPAAGPGSRAWRGSLSAASATPTGTTVMLRIPDSVLFGPAAPMDAKLWLAAASCEFLGSGPVNCMQQGSFPSGGQVAVDPANANMYSALDVSSWALVRRVTLASCPAMTELTTAGVQNGAAYDPIAAFSWPQRMHLDNDGNPANDPPNWFAGRVATTVATVANTIRARFYIADWGSQIGNLDVSQWTEIGHVDNTGGVASGGTEHLVLRWPPPTMPAAEQKQLACKYSKCDATVFGCPYPMTPAGGPNPACDGLLGAHTHHPHQCTQIRLSSTTYQLARDARIFNTDFVGASVFWRIATISTKGIGTVQPAPTAAPPEGREILIHVQALNMEKQRDEIPAASTVGRIETIGKHTGTPPPGKKPARELEFARVLRKHLGDDLDNDIGRQRQERVLKEVRNLPLDTVRMIAPVLEFSVYYDTGRLLDNTGGKPSRWLEKMTSFRYVAEHVGAIKGWEWALDGAEPLGNNWFRIRLADGADKQVRTRLQAVEDQHRMPGGNPVWPPGQAWISQPGAAARTKVKVSKKGGCSVAGDRGVASLALVLASMLWLRRRRH